MRVLALDVVGFRGIRKSRVVFGRHAALVGPNGCGKSTIIDALSLVFGRTQLVRELTEHDFFGSTPDAETRFVLVATLSGFSSEEAHEHPEWFREGRGIPKWWNTKTLQADPRPSADATSLCVQIGLAGRFDLEELKVEQLRYFYDDPAVVDPFDDAAVNHFPSRLLSEIGFYVLPVRRTWEATMSFASELFRRAVTTIGGIPAEALLAERDRLRSPMNPLEEDALLKPLVDRMDEQFRQLLPEAPRLKLRLTSTDSESLLRGLVPHYASGGALLPASRQGTGGLSLQTFVLLLEIGRERRKQGLSFILALEEPELHVPPGLQRKLVAQSVAIAEQTICASHAPRVAAFYPATSILVVDRFGGDLVATPMLAGGLVSTATSVQRKIYIDDRPRIVDALMHHRVLIPEGRGDQEWLRLLSDVVETGDSVFGRAPEDSTPFGAVVGVVPTSSSAVEETFRELRRLHRGLVPMVDGDAEGEAKVDALLKLESPPATILILREEWEIEDVVAWVLSADEEGVVGPLQNRLPDWALTSIAGLLARFKVKTTGTRAKTDYLAYEEIAAVIRDNARCRARGATFLNAIVRGALGTAEGCPELVKDAKSTPQTTVLRIRL
ncbi:MAG: DUF2813 domain-containing protein [Archangium sp.]